MRTVMFAVHDAAIKAFLPPFFARTKGEAIRSFSEAVMDEKHQFARHAKDYTLFELGEFDDGTGGFELPAAPIPVVKALDFIGDDIFTPDKQIK